MLRRTMFSSCFKRVFAASAYIRERKYSQRRLSIESLEQRTMLSATNGVIEVVFAPNTSTEYVESVEADLLAVATEYTGPEFAAFQFNDTERWSSTASSGSGLNQGDATTITWSIVPDGTSIHGYAGEAASPSDLREKLDGLYGDISVWLPLFQQTFDRLSALSGVNYVYEPNDDGSAWTSTTIAGGQLGVRGDIRIAGHNIDGNSGTLAYNFFPNFSDMVIDTGDMTGFNPFYANINNNSLSLRNVIAHEAGHGLGIEHVESNNSSILMEPFINLGFDGPQFDDILAMHRGYGDFNELAGNNTINSATALGTILSGQSVTIGADATDMFVSLSDTDFVSIDDNSDIDFFSFIVNETLTVDISLLPIGPTYNQGPQNGGQASFNSQLQSDLSLAIYDSNQATLLASSNTNGIGSGESLSSVSLSGAGQYYVRVTGAQNAAQMYQLSVSVNDGTVPPDPPNPPDATSIFYDSFENGEWNGLWQEDGQVDWFDSTQRSTEGSFSAEVDGFANNATLTMVQSLGMTTYSSATLNFDWLIENGYDTGEYLALDFTSDGTTWTEIARLNGNVDQENIWHAETIQIDPTYLTDNFKIRYRAFVSGGQEDANVDNVQIMATPVNVNPGEPPTADAGGPYTGNEGSNIVLDASASFEQGNDIVSYEWDLDNDGQYDDATGESTNFNSAVDGSFTIGLRVTDTAGMSDTDSTVVTVNNLAPTADAGGPYSGSVDTNITLSAASSTDPGNDIVSYAWDLDNDNQYDDATGVSVNFNSSTADTYTVSVRVTDDDGASTTDSTTVTVTGTNSLPTADIGGPYLTIEGSSVTLDASGSTDTDGFLVSWEWDLDNDGQYDDATGTTTSFSTTIDGVYNVGVRVTDNNGSSSTDSTTVTVSNVAPTADAGGPYSGIAGNNITLNASGSFDPGNDIVNYDWDLDNDNQYDDATGITATFNSSIAGNYTVGVRVTDNDGATTTHQTQVNVEEIPAGPTNILYFSLNNSVNFGGVSTANEDIIAFDGTNFSLFFDGSDVGLGGLSLNALSVISDTEILMSFTAAGTIGGISVDDSDIVKFSAISLGADTAGTFEMYFDGSDVNLTSGGEDLDAIDLLPDGSLLVSTRGSFSGAGASGADEDVFLFTPTSLGTNTSGSFSLYFDGGDVGLSSGGEDMDALALDSNGDLYISTRGNFSAGGASGEDDDIVVFTPGSLGFSTSGSFNLALLFDGSVFGLSGSDVNAIDLSVATSNPIITSNISSDRTTSHNEVVQEDNYYSKRLAEYFNSILDASPVDSVAPRLIPVTATTLTGSSQPDNEEIDKTFAEIEFLDFLISSNTEEGGQENSRSLLRSLFSGESLRNTSKEFIDKIFCETL